MKFGLVNVHTSISDGTLPVRGVLSGLVVDHNNIAGSLTFGCVLGASVRVPEIGECSIWATSPRGERNLYDLLGALTETDVSLEGCIVGSGVGGIIRILSGDAEYIRGFVKKVRDRGGEPVIEIPPTISPSAYRKIADVEASVHVASLFYHGGGDVSTMIGRPSPHPETRFLLDKHPLAEVLEKQNASLIERVFAYSPSVQLPKIKDADWQRFIENYDCPEIQLYGKWAPIIVVAVRFVEALRKSGVVCNLRGSGGASVVLRRAFGFPPPEEGLDIERFISPRRSSPPDVDIDVSDRVRALEILNSVCQEMGLRCYRLVVYHDTQNGAVPSSAPAGCIIVPQDYPLPEIVVNDSVPIPVAQIPSSIADKMPVCKIDVLQVDALQLLSRLNIDMSLGYQLREVPKPRTHVGIPQLHTSLGRRILKALPGNTLTLRAVVVAICAERPALSKYIPYILEKYLGVKGANRYFPNAQRPSGKIFLYQEALLKFIRSQLGDEAAERFRKEIKSSSPSNWAREVAKQLGIDLNACRYLYNLAHARSYAATVMLFAHIMAKYPQEYFSFFYERAGNDKEEIIRAAKEYGIALQNQSRRNEQKEK